MPGGLRHAGMGRSFLRLGLPEQVELCQINNFVTSTTQNYLQVNRLKPFMRDHTVYFGTVLDEAAIWISLQFFGQAPEFLLVTLCSKAFRSNLIC